MPAYSVRSFIAQFVVKFLHLVTASSYTIKKCYGTFMSLIDVNTWESLLAFFNRDFDQSVILKYAKAIDYTII